MDACIHTKYIHTDLQCSRIGEINEQSRRQVDHVCVVAQDPACMYTHVYVCMYVCIKKRPSYALCVHKCIYVCMYEGRPCLWY
jgi:hypothetical protein